jgi:pimeloyl-ACP methyl ester carboxylesterase
MIELPLPPGVERQVIETCRGPVTALRARPENTGNTGNTADATPAVMVSGFFGTKEDFREVLPVLARAGFDGWAYDYPGQLGPADHSDPSHYTIPQLAGQLREIIATVSGGQPAHVVGHCLGGFVAREAVLGEPELARSLTLLACGPSMREPKHRAMLGGLEVMHKTGGTITLWPLVKRLLAEDDQVMREFWHTKLATMNPHFVRGAAQSMGDERDRTTELIAAGVPSLVVHGKRDKRLWSAGAYADMARALNADLVVIDKAAHSPNMEQPGPTATALLQFWSAPAGSA